MLSPALCIYLHSLSLSGILMVTWAIRQISLEPGPGISLITALDWLPLATSTARQKSVTFLSSGSNNRVLFSQGCKTYTNGEVDKL